MHVNTLLREFAPLVSSPGGIQKLRELVLRLAVRGKLVPQNASDGHAEAILAKIGNDADSAVKKRIARYKSPDPIYQTPNNWAWTTIGRMSRDWGQKVPDKPFYYIDVGGIDNLKGRISSELELIQPENAPSRARKLIARGTVIYSTVRPYLKNIAVVDREFPLEAIASTAFAVVHPLGGIISEYVFYYLRSPDFVTHVEGQMMGVAYPAINDGNFFAAPIPIPPLAEQKRIVAKVEELMTLCDALEARQDKEAEQKRAAAASALHHLTEARTPEITAGRWSLLFPHFDELFDDLETIRTLREALIELALRGQFTSAGRVSQWPEKAFSEVAEIRSGVTKGRKLQGAEIISVPYLRVANVQRGFVDTKEVKSIEIGAHELDRFSLRRGDVLQIEGGDWDKVGRAALWNGEIDPCVHQNHVFSSRPADGLMPEFVVLWMNSPETKRYFISCSKQTTNLASINKTQLSNTPIVVPPLTEQKRIVVKVDELMSLCDRLEQQVREGERLNAELMASLIRALTETDPDGGGMAEPANLAGSASAITAPKPANGNASETPKIKSAVTPSKSKTKTHSAPGLARSVDTKFQEAVLVAAIVQTFFQSGGEPIGNFRLQKAVYFARRKMGEHVGEMAYLKKAAGPYNPAMKYSGGIAIAKQKKWLHEARGRFGFGHVPGADIGDVEEWIATYHYAPPSHWVAEHFRYKKNEEWETLATVDYAIEHLNILGIEPDAGQILQYIASDPEWSPKIEKLGLTEMSVGAAMLEVQTLFSSEGGNSSV